MTDNMEIPHDILDGLQKTFHKFRLMRRDKMIKLLEKMPCHCEHKARVEAAKKMGKQNRKAKAGYRFIVIFVIIMVLSFLLGMLYLTRRFNHAKYHGSGGCVLTFFYSYTKCDVNA